VKSQEHSVITFDQSQAGSYHIDQLRMQARRAAEARLVSPRHSLLSWVRRSH
jgi:hypothetical protein